MTDRRTAIGINPYEGGGRGDARTADDVHTGYVRQLQRLAHRSGNTDRRIIRGGIADGVAGGERAAPKAPYTGRGARDIALSMIIRHVNSIIRLYTGVAPRDLSRARSIRVGDPRLLRALAGTSAWKFAIYAEIGTGNRK